VEALPFHRALTRIQASDTLLSLLSLSYRL
jgi:hypothetical protein